MISLKCSNQPISPPPTPPSRAQAAMLRGRHRISNRAPPPLPPPQTAVLLRVRMPAMPEFPAADRSLPITCGRRSKVHRLSVHPDRPLLARRPCHRRHRVLPVGRSPRCKSTPGSSGQAARGAAALGEADTRMLAMGVTGTPGDILAAWPSSARQAPTPSTSTCTTSRTPTTSGSLAAKSSRRSPRFSTERAAHAHPPALPGLA
jgi:hypothetical protein